MWISLLLNVALVQQIQPSPFDDYAKFYPTFAMACAAGQASPIDAPLGQAWGHGVLFLKGACLDRSKDFPQLTRDCPAIDNEIGISADGYFQNLNWIATPGYDRFFLGNLKPDDVLDMNFYNRYVDEILALDVHRGLISRPDPAAASQPQLSLPELRKRQAQGSTGVDYSLAWMRDTYCARIPVASSQLDKMIAFLNERNAHYYSGVEVYNFSFPKNNCSHLVHNTFAAADIWGAKKVETSGLDELQNFSIPMNVVLNALDLMRRNFPSVIDVYRSNQESESLMEDHMLLTEDGALLDYIPVHGIKDQSLNKMFRNQSAVQFYDPWFSSRKNMLTKMLTEPRWRDLRTNQEHFLKVYQQALHNLKSEESYEAEAFFSPSLTGHRWKFAEVYARYRDYLESRISALKGL